MDFFWDRFVDCDVVIEEFSREFLVVEFGLFFCLWLILGVGNNDGVGIFFVEKLENVINLEFNWWWDEFLIL